MKERKKKIISIVNLSQLQSRVRLFVTPWTAACHVSLSITSCWSLLKPMHVHQVCDAICQQVDSIKDTLIDLVLNFI